MNIDPSKISSWISSMNSLTAEMQAMAEVTSIADQPLAAEALLKKYKCL